MTIKGRGAEREGGRERGGALQSIDYSTRVACDTSFPILASIPTSVPASKYATNLQKPVSTTVEILM